MEKKDAESKARENKLLEEISVLKEKVSALILYHRILVMNKKNDAGILTL